jgi:hypothetical protein
VSYASGLVRLWATIGNTEVDVIDASVVFALNTIPLATLTLPTGREVTTGLISNAHRVTKDTSILIPVEVFVELLPGSSEINSPILPEGIFKIFEGDVTGVGYRRTSNGLALSLELTHWLNDLNFSSTLSESSHPSNPTDFTFNAAMLEAGIDVGVTTGGGLKKHFVATTAAQSQISSSDIQNDLWGKAILPWFLDLARLNRISSVDIPGLKINDSVGGETKIALERFEGGPLQMEFYESDTQHAAEAIAADISVTTFTPDNTNYYGAMAHTTFWNKLVGDLGPTYLFSVVPFPDKAKIIPFVPGLRKTWQPNPRDKYTIRARDITYLDLNSRLPRALRALGLFGSHGSRTNHGLGGEAVITKSIGGMHVARDDGMIIFKQAPRWIADFAAGNHYSGVSSGGAGNPKSTAFEPTAGDAADATTNDKDPGKLREEAKGLFDALAHAMYANEVLKNRNGRVNGAVRFDISPGSTIRLEGTGSDFVAGSDAFGEDRYASVISVGYQFDAETRTAGTSFHLAHVRNEAENESDDTSLDGHPLYKNKFIGEVLINPE